MRVRKTKAEYGRGYIGARTHTTQQSGQTPNKEVDTNHITFYVSGTLKPIRVECCLPTTADCVAPTKWVYF